MASTTGSLTTTGSVTLTKNSKDTALLAQISGTYGSVTFVFEGTADGTNWSPLVAVRKDTAALVTGTVSPADNAEMLYDLDVAGLTGVRLRATAVGSGTLAVALASASYVGRPLPQVLAGMSFGATTFAGDVTLSSAEIVLNDVAAVTATGSVQGDAAALATQTSAVSAADGTKGVVLPAASAGLVRYVYNLHATNGLKVYPASGDDINDGTTDAAVTIEGKTLATFLALDGTTWAATYTPNS